MTMLEPGLGDLHDVELLDGAAIVVAQEGERRAEPRAKRRGDLGRVSARDREMTVIDGQLVL
jgi:hypothetical protein